MKIWVKQTIWANSIEPDPDPWVDPGKPLDETVPEALLERAQLPDVDTPPLPRPEEAEVCEYDSRHRELIGTLAKVSATLPACIDALPGYPTRAAGWWAAVQQAWKRKHGGAPLDIALPVTGAPQTPGSVPTPNPGYPSEDVLSHSAANALGDLVARPQASQAHVALPPGLSEVGSLPFPTAGMAGPTGERPGQGLRGDLSRAFDPLFKRLGDMAGQTFPPTPQQLVSPPTLGVNQSLPMARPRAADADSFRKDDPSSRRSNMTPVATSAIYLLVTLGPVGAVPVDKNGQPVNSLNEPVVFYKEPDCLEGRGTRLRPEQYFCLRYESKKAIEYTFQGPPSDTYTLWMWSHNAGYTATRWRMTLKECKEATDKQWAGIPSPFCAPSELDSDMLFGHQGSDRE